MALSGSIRSNTGTDLNLRVDWSATQDISANTSTITARLYLEYKSLTMSELNDSYLHRNWLEIDGNRIEYVRPAVNRTGATYITSKLLATHTKAITHNSDGSASAEIAASMRLGGTYDGVYIGNVTASKTIVLDNIDQTPPTVTLDVNNIMPTSVEMSMVASTTCDLWQYYFGGDEWTTVSTVSGTSITHTITGLTPNTQYTLYARARKASNQIFGDATEAIIFSTPGITKLNSVSTVTIDDSTVQITINRTIYSSSFEHTLSILRGGLTLATITGITGASGTGSQTLTLTTAQRSAILNAMPDDKSFTATFVLSTYNDDTLIGTSTASGIITTTADNSAPLFSGFTHKDTNSTTVAITGDNQKYIQGYSQLKVTATAASAQNGASIVQYTVSVGSKTATSASNAITVGTISSSGNVTVTVTVTDTRGYTASKSTAITVIPYSKISLDDVTVRRQNEVDALTEIDISGSTSAITVNGSAKNSLQTLKYRYKLTSSSTWSSWTTISPTISSSTAFAYEDDNWLSFDTDYSYDIEISASDKLTSDTVDIVLSQGLPLIEMRRKQVSINGSITADNIATDGTLRTGRVFYNVATFGYRGTTSKMLIKTRIPFVNSQYMPMVHLQGYAFGKRTPIDMRIAWYVYNGAYNSPCVTSTSAWQPTILLTTWADDEDYTAIVIDDAVYYPRFTINYIDIGLNGLAYSNPQGWTVSNVTDLTGIIDDTNMVTAPYKNAPSSTTDADTLDGKHLSDIYSYVNSRVYLKADTDNRNDNTKPNDYNGVFDIKGLKTNSTIGISTTDEGGYSCVLGTRGWSNYTGGYAHEFALGGLGGLYHRAGSTTSWSNWERIYTTQNRPTLEDIGAATDDHAHGYISNSGAVTSTATPASGDYILLSDTSVSSKIRCGIAIGSDTTKYLRNDGIWATPSGSGGSSYTDINVFTSTYGAKDILLNSNVLAKQCRIELNTYLWISNFELTISFSGYLSLSGTLYFDYLDNNFIVGTANFISSSHTVMPVEITGEQVRIYDGANYGYITIVPGNHLGSNKITITPYVSTGSIDYNKVGDGVLVAHSLDNITT